MVDILLATYNGVPYLSEQIGSVIAQSCSDWNLLVSDDGSSDGTVELVDGYVRMDPRIRWANRTTHEGGARGNFMSLLRRSTADYVMFCDQDDVWSPDKIELTLRLTRQLEEEHPDAPVMVFTDMEVVDERLDIIYPSFWGHMGIDSTMTDLVRLMVAPTASGCTMLLNARLRELVCQTPPDTPMIMHDWWVSLVAAGLGVIGSLDVTTSKYRQHAHNVFGVGERANSFSREAWLEVERSNLRHLVQAQSFLDVYGHVLDASLRRRLEHFCAIRRVPRLARLALLVRSGAWKFTLRSNVAMTLALVVMDMRQDSTPQLS